jgi:YesN/AraC family two-component response regulator
VEVARDGREAKALLAAWRFDILLTDLKLPDTDGLSMVRYGLEKTPSIPGVIMTGFATVPSVVEALRLGASDVVLKPFKLREVHEILTRAIERSNALRDLTGTARALDLLEKSEIAEQRPEALSPLAEVLASLPGARFAEVTQGRVTIATHGAPLGECAGWALPGGYRVRIEPPTPTARPYVLAAERALRRAGL